jgi:hypothetical protein
MEVIDSWELESSAGSVTHRVADGFNLGLLPGVGVLERERDDSCILFSHLPFEADYYTGITSEAFCSLRQ